VANLPVAIIGGGWAGCAAAVTIAQAGVPVALYEVAATLGGRARRVERAGLPLDNGQHLLLGAYTRTRALLALVHEPAAARAALTRRPLTMVPLSAAQDGALTLRARAAPGHFGLLVGLLTARGLTLSERCANLAWFSRLRRGKFARPAHETVATMLAPLPPRVAKRLWEPLCLAALNTPVATASAQVFANVLAAAFAGAADASDFLIAANDLSALFPEAAARYVEGHGGAVRTGVSTRIVRAAHDGAILAANLLAQPASAVIVAVGPHQLRSAFAPEMLTAQPALQAFLGQMESLSYEPIATVWLGYGTATRLPAPITRLDDAPGQWVVDRPDIVVRGRSDGERPALAQVLAVIVSAGGPHRELDMHTLARTVDAQLRRLKPSLPGCVWSQAIVEKRATYACTPRRVRPAGPRLSPGVYLAGDYVDADLPATLEAAVRSGTAAADALLADLGHTR
jgi:squalene-associated FAD-dependent desaturase